MTDLQEDDRQPLSLPDFLARDDRLGLAGDDGESIDVVAVVARLHELVIDRVDLAALLGSPTDEGREIATEAIQVLMPSAGVPNIESARERVTRMVLDEIFGLGPLQPLLDDPTVQEIMVNAPDTVYTESDGILKQSNVRFLDEDHVRAVANRILIDIGRRVDEASPMVDARLPDGSRVNITIPPASPRNSTITIRKFRKDRLSLDSLVEAGSLDLRMTEFISACVTYRRNILVSGGTGAGKTTLLNAISAYIPRNERIITIEDPLELSLQKPHVIAMESRPADMTGSHEITQRDLLRNALRMRPDRIIIGEVRGVEAFDMLQAMNTGHDGSLSTVHANTARDALSRLENMVLMAGLQLPIRAIREQVASALDLIVHIERDSEGVRRVVDITEVVGMEGDHITISQLYRFERGALGSGQAGVFRPTGIRPAFAHEMELRGRPLQAELFAEGALA